MRGSSFRVLALAGVLGVSLSVPAAQTACATAIVLGAVHSPGQGSMSA